MANCGDPCKRLTDLQRRFHLLKLAEEAKPPGERRHNGLLAKEAGSGATSRAGLESVAARMLADDRVIEALHWHRKQGAKRVEINRELVAAELLSLAKIGRVKTADLVTVRARPSVSREELETILEMDDDAARAEALRKMIEVQLLPWEGEGAVDPELTRGVTVKQKKDGTVELIPPSPTIAANALAQLRQMYAFDEKSKEAEALEAVLESLGAAAVSALSPYPGAFEKLMAAIRGRKDPK